MPLTLRYYQEEAVDAVMEHIKKRVSPCVIELATGAGKSLCVAELASRITEISPDKRIICLAPSKELVVQNFEKYTKDYGLVASLFSASAGSKDLRHKVVFATPLTLIKKIDAVARSGVAAIIIDEAHGLTSTIKEIVESIRNYEINGVKINEKVRLIGMGATLYRTGTGYIYATDASGDAVITYDEAKAKAPYFSRLVYRKVAGELVAEGYLSKVVIGEVDDHYDTSSLEIERGLFTAESVRRTFDGNTKTERITQKVAAIAESQGRRGVMFFAATISHAEEIASYLPVGQVRVITGKLKKSDREKFINEFKAKRIKYLVNVDVLTTGFDAPHVSLIAILRATDSPGLFQQIIGRGLRLSPGKEDCLILDYAENIERHKLESDIFSPEIKVKKDSEALPIDVECPACHAISIKTKRTGPMYDGLKHDRFGNFIISGTERPVRMGSDDEVAEWDGVIMTMNIIDPTEKDEFGDYLVKAIPMPAHYSRRCTNPEAYLDKGQPVACGHRFSMKICPKCFAENDIAARHCIECKDRLVDPNGKLTDTAGIGEVMMNHEIRRIKCFGLKAEPWITRSGSESAKVVYRTEIGEVTAWHKRSTNTFRALSNKNGTDENTTSYEVVSAWVNAPVELTIQKMVDGDYTKFNVKGVHYVEGI